MENGGVGVNKLTLVFGTADEARETMATPEVVHWEGQTHETDGDE